MNEAMTAPSSIGVRDSTSLQTFAVTRIAKGRLRSVFFEKARTEGDDLKDLDIYVLYWNDTTHAKAFYLGRLKEIHSATQTSLSAQLNFPDVDTVSVTLKLDNYAKNGKPLPDAYHSEQCVWYLEKNSWRTLESGHPVRRDGDVDDVDVTLNSGSSRQVDSLQMNSSHDAATRASTEFTEGHDNDSSDSEAGGIHVAGSRRSRKRQRSVESRNSSFEEVFRFHSAHVVKFPSKEIGFADRDHFLPKKALFEAFMTQHPDSDLDSKTFMKYTLQVLNYHYVTSTDAYKKKLFGVGFVSKGDEKIRKVMEQYNVAESFEHVDAEETIEAAIPWKAILTHTRHYSRADRTFVLSTVTSKWDDPKAREMFMASLANPSPENAGIANEELLSIADTASNW